LSFIEWLLSERQVDEGTQQTDNQEGQCEITEYELNEMCHG
jgi:hypothetical protein